MAHRRARYRPSGRGATVVPVKRLIGLTGGRLMPAAAGLSVNFMSCLTARESADMSRRLCGAGPAVSGLVRLSAAGWREAAYGVVAQIDATGAMLRTRYFARLPEPGKARLEAQISQEVRHWMKRAGQRWGRDGSQGVLTFRAFPNPTGSTAHGKSSPTPDEHLIREHARTATNRHLRWPPDSNQPGRKSRQ